MPSRPLPDTAMPDRTHRPSGPVRDAAPRCLDSVELLRGDTELHIRHGARLYRLRRTRQDKLILTT